MTLRDYSEKFNNNQDLTGQYVYFESYSQSGEEMWYWGMGKIVLQTKLYIEVLPFGETESQIVSYDPRDFLYDILIPLGL